MNEPSKKDKKLFKEESLPISPLPLDERLNAIADIIIERLLEEKSKNTTYE